MPVTGRRVSKREREFGNAAKERHLAVRLSTLPTLAEMQATRRAIPKFIPDHVLETPKAKREAAKRKSRASDRKRFYAWANKVKRRDGYFDRYDGRPVVKTNEPIPRRAEAHHIVSRSDTAVCFDVRNGLCLSAETHVLVEQNKLIVQGTRFFTKDGKKYIDGSHPVLFIRRS